MSSPSQNPLKRLIHEIHRRSLWQVLGIYVAGSWAVLEAIQGITEVVSLPDWLPALALVLLLIGLPIVLATAFVQEGGPGRREDEEESAAGVGEVEASPSSRLFTWRKAILGGVVAFALWGLLAAGWLLFGGGELPAGLSVGATASDPSDAARQSVAVLPFENVSADPENEYFSDGVTEELLNVLARLPGLRVPGRTSSFAFKNQNLTIREIADTLHVAHVLEGSVRRIEDRARITVQLIEAETDATLWAESFNRELVDLFEVQEEIARRVAQALVATVPELQTSSPASRPDNAAAYEAYLRGLQLLHRRTRESFLAAMNAFRRSYGLDPRYAPAYAGHAIALAAGVAYRVDGEIDDYRAFARALALADRALDLDPQNANAYAARGWILNHAWAPAEEVEAAFRQALTLQQNSADIHGWYGHFLTRTGAFDRALAEHERALTLDPLAPGRRVGHALDALAAGRHHLALRQTRAALVIEPSLSDLRRHVAQTLLLQGRADECLSYDLRPYPAVRAACLHGAGRSEEAQELVNGRIRAIEDASTAGRAQGSDAPYVYYDLSVYHAWTGDVEGVLRWLDRAFAQSPIGVSYQVVQSALFDRVQGDSRFSRRWEEIKKEVWSRVRRAAVAERRRLEEAQ